MKSVLSGIGKTIFHAMVFGVISILTIVSITYALTYNWGDPSGIRNQSGGNILTSSGWNLLIGNVDNLNERITNMEGKIQPGTIGGGCELGSAWGNATSCGITQTMICPTGYRAQILTYCQWYSSCAYNGTNAYPMGICIKT